MSGTPREGSIRRKPSYSEVLKATPVSRPSPINTDVTREMRGGAKDTSTTASSSFWSPGSATLNTGYTAPTPLFSPSIWSPLHRQPQSATVAPKSSWEATMNGKINEVIAAKSASPRGAAGLGVQLGNGKTADSNRNASGADKSPGYITSSRFNPTPSSSPYEYTQHDLSHAQTKPFLKEGGGQLSRTAPILQKPFYGPGDGSTPARIPKRSPEETNGGQIHDLAATGTNKPEGSTKHLKSPSYVVVHIQRSEGGSDGDGINALGVQISQKDASTSDVSYTSEISEDPEGEERRSCMQAPMIAEEAHPQNFVRTLMDGHVAFSTAFDGADAICTATNPSHYAMDYGSRVICVKTDFVENIHWAVKNGIWAFMDKVAARIMALWKECSAKNDKIVLVFSVNGQKSYCGLAEMSGAWKQTVGIPEGFKIKKEGKEQIWGTMPITWIFVKNVSYYWFRDIQNPHSNQDIVNMWNGMHYPSKVAREVVERIIHRPHFTNVLAWRQDQSYDPFYPVLEASQIDPLAGVNGMMGTMPRLLEDVHPTGPRQNRESTAGHGFQSTRASALSITNWRKPQEYAKHGEGSAKRSNASSTPPNLDGHASPRPKQGQLVLCKVDDAGNFVPVTPSGGAEKTPVASLNANLIEMNTPRGSSPSFVPKPRANNHPARAPIPAFHGGRGGNAAVRGNFHAVNDAEGAIRVTSTPPVVRKQPSFAGYVGPQIRRMKSDMGLEDPFGTPRTTTQGDALPKVMNRNRGAPLVNSAFQRSMNSANFAPQGVAISNIAANPITESVGVAALYNNSTSEEHAQGISGGVMLDPPSSNGHMTNKPSRAQVQESVNLSMARRDFTPTGRHIYPSPIDQAFAKSPTEHVAEKRSDKSMSEAEIDAEYTEYLLRQSVLQSELMGLKFKQAGVDMPEHLKTVIAADSKRD